MSALPLEFSTDFVAKHDVVAERNTALLARTVDKRASLLQASDLLTGAAIDKYSFTRDSYLQYRRNQIYDGNPPDEPDLPDPSADPAPTK